MRVPNIMPWPPPKFAYSLKCLWLACLSICASAFKCQQIAKPYTFVSTSTYLSIHQSAIEKRTCNGRHHLSLFESFGSQRHEDESDIAPSKEDKRSSISSPWNNINSVFAFQSPPATPTLLDKTYKRAARGAALALYVSDFLHTGSPSSPNYDWSDHYRSYFLESLNRATSCLQFSSRV